MKQVLLMCLLLINGIILEAQTIDFAPVGAKWWINQIVLDPIPADSFVIVEVTHEEVKDGELCRVITNLSGCGLPNPAYVYTRNDTVFFFSEVTEQFELLYDFTATVGSSWTVKGLSHIFGNEHTVTVTDVKYEEYYGKLLKTWLLDGNFTVWGDRIVEKAGNLWHIGPTYSEDCIPGQDGFMPHYLRCYEEDGELYKFVFTDCDEYDDISVINDIAHVSYFHLTPNPASVSTRLELDASLVHDRDIRLRLFHPSGKAVYEGVLPANAYIHDIPVDLLASGIYYILLEDHTGRLLGVEKLLITP